MALQYKALQSMSVNEGLERENAENLKWYARLLGADKKIIRTVIANGSIHHGGLFDPHPTPTQVDKPESLRQANRSGQLRQTAARKLPALRQ